jgi:SAM-dependent methyltransferase
MTTNQTRRHNPVRGRINALLLRLLDAYMHAKYGALKRRLFAGLPERVVELGPGAGANFRYFRPGTHVVAVEPNLPMHARLRAAAARHELVLELVPLGAEGWPLAAGSADVVIATLVLCTVPDPVSVLGEVKRVLRPQGRFICIEHVAGRPGSFVAFLQRLLHRPWRWFFEGCDTNRPTARLLREAGFASVACEELTMPTAFVPIRPQIAAVCTK